MRTTPVPVGAGVVSFVGRRCIVNTLFSLAIRPNGAPESRSRQGPTLAERGTGRRGAGERPLWRTTARRAVRMSVGAELGTNLLGAGDRFAWKRGPMAREAQGSTGGGSLLDVASRGPPWSEARGRRDELVGDVRRRPRGDAGGSGTVVGPFATEIAREKGVTGHVAAIGGDTCAAPLALARASAWPGWCGAFAPQRGTGTGTGTGRLGSRFARP